MKLYSDREGRLLTGKTYSCYVEAGGDERKVTVSGQKMFHNFSSSADPTDKDGRFQAQNIKPNSERDKEHRDTNKPRGIFLPKIIKLNSKRDEDEKKKKTE